MKTTKKQRDEAVVIVREIATDGVVPDVRTMRRVARTVERLAQKEGGPRD